MVVDVAADLLKALLDIETAALIEIYRHYSFSIDDTLTVLNASVIPTMPWNEFTIYNDGGDPVYVDINEIKAHDTPLNMDEAVSFNMKSPSIHEVFLQCDTGDSCDVRIYAGGKRYPGNTSRVNPVT